MKIRIVIVDDELHICSLVKGLIDQMELPVWIEKSFSEGEACLAYILEHKPDIVISDIQIGDISGLDIIRQVRSSGLDTCFIVISGYNYFDYAKQAIQYDVENYLLKPIQKKELKQAIKNAILKINDKRGKEEKIKTMSSQKRGRDEQLFLRELWEENSKSSSLSIAEINKKYELLFEDTFFTAGMVHFDEQSLRLCAQMAEHFRTILEMTGFHYAVNYWESRNVLFLINCESTEYENLQKALRGYLRQVEEAYVLEGRQVTIALASPRRWGEQMITAIRIVRAGIKSRMGSKKRLITERDIRINDEKVYQKNLLDFGKKLSGLMETLNYEEIRKSCADTFKWYYKNAERYELLEAAEWIVDFLEGEVRKLVNDSTQLSSDKINGLEGSEVNLNAFFDAYMRNIDSLLMRLENKPEEAESKTVAIVKKYIQENYQKHIELEDLAELVFLSPAYLSSQFKEAAGEGVKEYLMRVRMDRAKELLMGIEYNIMEIAHQVGFSDAKYFAKAFKKYTSVKPTDYRKIQSKWKR